MYQSLVRAVKNEVHKYGAIAANVRYGFPGRKMRIIGVTGTDGKTTTSHLIYHILKTAGKKVSMASTVLADIAGNIGDTGLHFTTENHWVVQKNLAQALTNGSEFFVLETTSHALHQHRVWGVQYEVGVLTNITPEHLDYHKTFDAYVRTKAKLLLNAKKVIINEDADVYEQIKGILDKAHKKYTTYSLINENAPTHWSDEIKTSIKETFNRENILAAYACCKELGLSAEDILKGIKTFALPKGRLDKVYDKDFTVYIDFAHTPHSIAQLLKGLKTPRNTLIHVFGSAGLRDSVKRPEMGKSSGSYADVSIITEEDYRTEDFMKITRMVSAGLYEKGFSYMEPDVLKERNFDGKAFTIIKNRQKAIEFAIDFAQKGDVVVLTGKGHEQSLARKLKEFPWDEYKAVERAIAKK
ncbi:UDP-N-acetylmuramyl-tripeptide synthetase [Candidatus Woesebacteria bacterium]|nr:UDP-N-acetylmuramyl-tripeptide synthetase [Candidatus Woesebacteria bacterium]